MKDALIGCGLMLVLIATISLAAPRCHPGDKAFRLGHALMVGCE